MSTECIEPDATLSKHAVCECTQAVIGAGAAGLVAARELLREGHTVQVFEQGERIGGIWDYSPGLVPTALPWTCLRLLPHCTLNVYRLSPTPCACSQLTWL